ncbi:MAG: PEGA domain-containing protein [Candidatus Saccharibacteria bacterium]|nr:PEGA domain-containing protein [Candidatus Saccharibacteria bacterium]
MDRERKRSTSVRLGIIAVFAVLILIIIYSVSTIIGRIGKVKVTILYAPFASTVTFNGEKVPNNGDAYLEPGKYAVKVEFENFKTLEENVEIRNEDSGSVIFGQLTAANDTGVAYAKKHISEFNAISAQVSAMETEFGKTEYEKYPLKYKLPIKDPHYTLSYEITEDEAFNITIKATDGYIGLAINKLYEKLTADEIASHMVVMKDLASPFTGEFTQNAETDPYNYLLAGYGAAMNGFSKGSGKTTKSGYYYGFISQRDGYVSKIYRYILKKNGDGWKLCGYPYPVLSTPIVGDVPVEIITSANKL